MTAGAYAMDAAHEWILCLRCNEALSDELEAALVAWKEDEPDEGPPCYSVPIRMENGSGWEQQSPEVRLVNRKRMNWMGEMPPAQTCSEVLRGDILSFREP